MARSFKIIGAVGLAGRVFRSGEEAALEGAAKAADVELDYAALEERGAIATGAAAKAAEEGEAGAAAAETGAAKKTAKGGKK